MASVIYSARTNFFLYSPYILGLRSVFGPSRVHYGAGVAPDFEGRLSFVTSGPPVRRIVICAEDSADIHMDALRWCDLYAKVNVDPSRVPAESAMKIIPIGPSLGIRIHSLFPTVYHAVRSFDAHCPNAREHFANYYRQFACRLEERRYVPGKSDKGYVYFSGTIWKNDTATNEARALFIMACKAIPSLRFEGGFRPRHKNDVPGYEHLTVPTPRDHARYVRLTQASAVVFNTPAVLRCHGWKLAEFLALGKAIISTPLERLLPAPLVHGQQIHYVDGRSMDSMKSAIELICQDDAYRQRLEQGARQYYLDYLQPATVISRILAAAGYTSELSQPSAGTLSPTSRCMGAESGPAA